MLMPVLLETWKSIILIKKLNSVSTHSKYSPQLKTMKTESITFFIFACAVIIANTFEWYNDTTTPILVMVALGFFNLIRAVERK